MSAGMDATHWRRLETLFDEGIALAPEQRAAWLAALDVDEPLRRELAAMLAADTTGNAGLTRRVGDALADADLGMAAGERVGDYVLVRELGSGGNGVVYLAERADADFEQQVAIKLIRGIAGGEAARRLRRERQILAGLDHVGIARLLDGGQTAAGQPYLVMEFVRGESITDYCKRRSLPLRDRLALMRDVAQAVHYAHQRLVIHRDIKPANVMVREDGRPVLLDFGIAKLLDPNDSAAGPTMPWFTPAYAAPEQRRGEDVSTATDVYALGLLLCELLVDRPPLADAEGRVLEPSRTAPRGRRGALRGDLDRIVARATAEEPDRRYASAQALADDMERHLAGRPIHAAPDSLWYRGGKLLRRHPVGAAAALAVAVVIAAFGWRLAAERDRALQAEAVAREESVAAASVTDFLTDLFSDAAPGAVGNSELTPSALIDRGRARLAANADVPDRLRARLLSTLGAIYGNLGLPTKASQTLEEAVAALRADGSDPALLADTLHELGIIHDHRGVHAEAVAVHEAELALRRELGDTAGIASALASLGLVTARTGDLDRAEKLLREAVARLRGAGEAEESALAEVYLAETLQQLGRTDEARETMNRGIGYLRRALPPDHPDLLSALTFHQTLLRQQGDLDGAERVLLDVLAQRGALLREDSVLLANVHSALGSLYYERGRTRDAAAQMVAALEINARVSGPDDPTLAIDHNNVAALYEEQGDYATAEPAMRRALEIVSRHVADDPFPVAHYRQNLGRLLMLAGQAEESRELLEWPIGDEAGDHWALQRARQQLHLAEWHRRYGDAAQADVHVAAALAKLDDLGGAGSPRHAQLLRTQALLKLVRGDRAGARAGLEQALSVLEGTRGDAYVGCGELRLDLAALAHDTGDAVTARRQLDRAQAILDPVLAPDAPQRAQLVRLRAALLPVAGR